MLEQNLIPPISEDVVRQTLHERLPMLPLEELLYLGGASYSVFGVNRQYVFRFPKHLEGMEAERYQETQAAFATERRLLELLRPTLQPHVLPMQTHNLPGPSAAFPGPVFGYCFFDAQPLSARMAQLRNDLEFQQAAAVLLGNFLSKLHSIPVDEIRALGWQTPTAHALAHEWVEEYERLATEILPKLPPAEQTWLRTLYEEFLAGAGVPAVTLIHGDLGAENVLLDQTRSKLYVIDWEDTEIGDPAKDVCLWYGELGSAFLDALLAHYNGADPAQIRNSVHFYYNRIPIIYLSIGMQFGQPSFFDYGRRLLQIQMIQQP